MVFRRVFPVIMLLVALPMCAQEGTPGSAPLTGLAVNGSSRFDSQQIVPTTGLHVGATVTRNDIQKGADALAASGLFANVQYRFDTDNAGVRVQYEVADAKTYAAYFDNFPWFTEADLMAALKSSVRLFDGRVPDHGSVLGDVASALSRELVSRGVSSTVSYELVTLPGQAAPVIRFQANEASLDVEHVEFTDDLAKNDHGIQDRLSDLIGKPFSRTNVETFEYEQIRPVYLAHAFLRASFGAPIVSVTGRTVNVRVPITPGHAYTWNGAYWVGNQAIPSADLSKLVQLNQGGEADGMKIEATWEEVRKAYYKLGYLDLELMPSAHLDDATNRARYDVILKEGPQYHMGSLVLSGLSMEGERRIRSGWRIPQGAIFNEGVYEEFIETGVKQSFAGLPVHYEKIGKYLQKDPGAAKVDVMLDFQ